MDKTLKNEMTLRDHFASIALEAEVKRGTLADGNVNFGDLATLTKRCYKIADAMVTERSKQSN